MPNTVYISETGNPPNSISVDGQCFQFNGLVSSEGKSVSETYEEFSACHVCQQGLPPAVDCGGDPDIIMTISGGPWNTTPVGVSRICPTTYTGPEGNSEYWAYYHPVVNGDYFFLRVDGNAPGLDSIFRFRNQGSTDNVSFNTGVTGSIKDRLFTSLTVGGVTLSIQRGNNW